MYKVHLEQKTVFIKRVYMILIISSRHTYKNHKINKSRFIPVFCELLLSFTVYQVMINLNLFTQKAAKTTLLLKTWRIKLLAKFLK